METQIIDIVGIDKARNQVNLIIMDHDGWEDVRGHIDDLQERILSYVTFIENGTFVKKYSNLSSLEIVIKTVFEHTPTEEGQKFVDQIQNVLKDIGYHLEFVNFASL